MSTFDIVLIWIIYVWYGIGLLGVLYHAGWLYFNRKKMSKMVTAKWIVKTLWYDFIMGPIFFIVWVLFRDFVPF
jgi:hypothetical protein